jgi:lipid-A-disaccharide synthase
MKTSCLIVAGEQSGEDHCLGFLPSILDRFPEINIFGVGGQRMQKHGVELLYTIEQFSAWGVSEVVGQIPFYWQAFHHLLRECEHRQTQTAILIDFQTFNLNLAKRLASKKIKVMYYVAPQAWAWKAWRAKTIQHCVEVLFTILPFEKKWFEQRGVESIVSVRHPLLKRHKDFLHNNNDSLRLKRSSPPQKEVRVLLLPGSRRFEIENLMPIFIEACLKMSYSVKVSIVYSSSVNESVFAPYRRFIDYHYNESEMEQAFLDSDLALASSGTITLACALFELPTIVCYKSSLLNEFIFLNFVNYRGAISLANLVHQDVIFPELLQDQVSSFNINSLVAKFLEPATWSLMKAKLSSTIDLLDGESEDGSEKIIEVINQAYEN